MASCVIPATDAAVELMHRRFGVPDDAGSQSKPPAAGIACVDCPELPPVEVIVCRYGGAYPECNPPPGHGGGGDDDPDPWRPPPGSGGDDDWGGGGGGGDGGNQSRSGVYDGSGELLDCPRPDAGFADERCATIDEAIEHLKNHPEELCRSLGQAAHQRHYHDKKYFYWDSPNAPKYGGASLMTGEIGLTPAAFDPGELENTIAHEESHFPPFNYHDRRTGIRHPADGRYAEDVGALCKAA